MGKKREIKRWTVNGIKHAVALKYFCNGLNAFAIAFNADMTDDEIRQSLKNNPPTSHDWKAFNNTFNCFELRIGGKY